jgi:hypothetical protein
MENETLQQNAELIAERLAAVTTQLEQVIAGMDERHTQARGDDSQRGDLQRIVATAEGAPAEPRDIFRQELEVKLLVAEQKIASLQAQLESHATASVRRTVGTQPAQMFSKNISESASGMEPGAVDAALSGLSLEQRIAVKSQLARAGLLG